MAWVLTSNNFDIWLAYSLTDVPVCHSMNGFENRDGTLSWSDSTYTFTYTPSATDYYWVEGVRYSITGAISKQIGDVSGIHVIYFDDAAPTTLTSIANPTHDQLDDIIVNCCIMGIVYWNTNDDVAYVLADERHGKDMSSETHHWIHDNIGASFKSGGTLSGYTLDSAADADISFDITDIDFYDEDIEFDITDGGAGTQYEQVLTGDAEIPVLYRDDVDGSWTEQAASTLPYIVSATPQPTYNKDDGDGTWSQQDMSNSKFVNYYLVATNDWRYPIKMVQGDTEYANITEAINGVNAEIGRWGTLPSAEWVLLYTFHMQQANGGTKELKIIRITDFRFSRITGASTVAATDHGSLTGLGDDDHLQYLLIAGSRAMTGDLDMGSQSISSLASILGDLTVVDGSPCVHLSDSDYYSGSNWFSRTFGVVAGGTGSLSFWDGTDWTHMLSLLDSGGIDVANSDIVLDEDAMGSDDATRLATQQSIKAYVDASGGPPGNSNWDKFLSGVDNTTWENVLNEVDERYMYIGDAAPGTTFPGRIWLDTASSPATEKVYYGSYDATSGTGFNSGTAWTWGIPHRIVIVFAGVSNDTAAQSPIVQLANQSDYQIASYQCYVSVATANVSYTTGFFVHENTGWAIGDTKWCIITLDAMDSGYLYWHYNMNGQNNDEASLRLGEGFITLTSAFNAFRVRNADGAAAFDAGTIYWKAW